MKKDRLCQHDHPIPDGERRCPVCIKDRNRAHERLRTKERRKDLDETPQITPPIPTLDQAQAIAYVWEYAKSQRMIAGELGITMKQTRLLLVGLRAAELIEPRGRGNNVKYRATGLGWASVERARVAWGEVMDTCGCVGLMHQ